MRRLRPWVGELVFGTGDEVEERGKRGSGEIGGMRRIGGALLGVRRVWG
jgi:hypothetical protein